MIKEKKLLDFAVPILIGIVFGMAVGYGITNSNILRELPLKNTESVSQTTCELPTQEALTEGFEDSKLEITDPDLKAAAAYLKFKEIKESHIPTGIPAIYGQELNISFDSVQDAINKVSIYDPTYGKEGKKIILTGEDLNRYIDIGFKTSCQYCCTAETLVREDGQAACGCDHSQMMRGLAAYLIKNHPELSNEQILSELNTWKISYFPKQTLTEKLTGMEKAGEPGIKEILEEFPEFMPQMIGGC